MSENRIPLNVITVSEHLENILRENLVKTEEGTKISLDPNLFSNLINEIKQKLTLAKSEGFHNIPIICRPDIRLYFRRLLEKDFPRLQVLSYMEISPEYKLEIIFVLDI